MRDVDASDARVRKLALTKLGRECAEKTIPLWQQAQAVVEDAIGGAPQWRELNKRLKTLNGAVLGDRRRLAEEGR